MTDRIYLDWNATAPLRAEARAAMSRAMDIVGNPSSVHAEGRAARALVERARAQVAAAVGAKPHEVVFTSGATEAASVLAMLSRQGRVVVQDTAHDCLWTHRSSAADGPEPDGDARVVAMGLANSETGVISDLPGRQDGRWLLDGATADLLLLDVTQAVGRIPWSFAWSGADLAILSAHKLGGPKGVGALLVRDGLDIPGLQTGGGQELGRRSGTENLTGIAGFGAAIDTAMRDLETGLWEAVAQLRKILELALASAAKDTIFVGIDGPRLPNTACMAVPGWKGETQVMAMDLAGFAISAGSACSSGKVRESRVLRAMGYAPEVARSAIRVSLGPATTRADIDLFVETWTKQYEKFRQRAA